MADDFETRLAAAKARVQKAKETLAAKAPERDRRRELADAVAEADEAEREERYEQLLDRLEVARAKFPDDAFEPLMIKCFPDTFIVRRNSKAHAAWRAAVVRDAQAQARGQKVPDRAAALDRQYAVDCIYDWNGETAFDTNPELSRKLHQFLTENVAIVDPITNLAGKLAGVYADARSKSD